MTNLDSFKSDLALEQDFSYNPRIRGKDNADSQCINAETNERNETLKTRQQGLGHAFLVLFQANRSALKRAINDIYGENTLSSAVRSLITHVETIGEKNQDETSLPQIQQVYRPLLDKVLKRSDEPGKRIAFILLDWLILDYPYKSLVALALSSDLGPAIDKKRKLSVLLAIEHALHSANARKSKSEGNRAPSRQVLDQADVQTLGTDAAESEAYPGAQILLQWTLLLSQIIRFDGAAGAGSSRSMTRLTSLAFDVSIEISKVLADQTLRDMKLAVATHELRLVVELNSHEEADAVTRVTYGWCFTQSMLAMDVILQEYQACNQKGNSIASASLVDTLDIISRFNKYHKSESGYILSQDIFVSFAQSWSVISSALGQRNSTSSSHLMLEKSEGYLQMNLPPYLRLLAACILLGQCDLSTMMDQVLELSGNFSRTLFTLSNIVIAEDIPVGRNVAHAVQDIYVTFASKLDLEHLKPQVFSALDNATEISVESAELVSQYIMAFQTSLLPELLKLLPDCNHQILWESCDGLAFARTKNALCVVEALAEKDFFSIPLSKEDNDTRCLVENSILGLLQENNVGIRNKARQIIALIDTYNIFQRLGSELMSDNARSCSNSEATMIECMLSQRSDGSLGDGFISFVEYLRSHQRFSLRIAGTKLKSPAQLVLNVKKMASGSLDQDSDGIMTERLLHVLKLLGDAIPGNLWSGIIDRLALKTYGSPSDQLLIRVWNMLALAIANIPEAIEAVSASILHIMEHQGALTEEILEEALESCDEAIDDLRFARLSPLLILKTIPTHGFTHKFRKFRPVGEGNESELISYQMLQALKSRSDNQMEFSLVRTLSKAVMQGMFPESSLEIIFTGLTKSCSEKSTQVEQIDLVETRSWLFTLYDWVLHWTISSNSQEQNEQDISWIYQISADFFYKIVSFKSTTNDYEQDLYKLQLGVVDVFSKVLLATSPFYCHTPNTQFTAKLKRLSRNVSCLTTANTTEATIEEPAYGESVETRGSGDMSQTPKSPEDLFMAILSDILDAITSPVFEYKEANIGIALCLVNVFIMSLQGLAPTPNSKVSKSSTKDLEGISISRSLIASTLMDLLTPLVSACIITFLNNMETLNSKGYTLLTQGCIQILYTGASISATMDGHTISRATKQQMMGVTVMGINCSDPAIAVASLKLLAMMSGSRMMTTELLTDGNLAAIRKGLIQLRHSNGSQFGSPASVTLLLDKMWEIVA